MLNRDSLPATPRPSIRRASAEELLRLWRGRSGGNTPPTAVFFADHIRHENAEFWALERSGELIGELYVFKSLPDRDFADGRTKAYLCAFLVREADRGKGLGSQLLSAVLARLKADGFRYVTIGVEKGDEANLRLYRRHGFSVTIKECRLDPCFMDEEMRPRACPCFLLLSKTL